MGTDYMGSSLAAINDVAVQMDYTLVSTHFVGANAFFVRNDLTEGKFDTRLTVEELYNPPRYHLFHDHFCNCSGHRPDFGPYADLI